MKTVQQYLEEQKNRALHNLFHYSKNYAMTKPAEGMDEEYAEALRDCKIVEELIAQHSKTQSANMKYGASVDELRNATHKMPKVIIDPINHDPSEGFCEAADELMNMASTDKARSLWQHVANKTFTDFFSCDLIKQTVDTPDFRPMLELNMPNLIAAIFGRIQRELNEVVD